MGWPFLYPLMVGRVNKTGAHHIYEGMYLRGRNNDNNALGEHVNNYTIGLSRSFENVVWCINLINLWGCIPSFMIGGVKLYSIYNIYIYIQYKQTTYKTG